MNTAISALIALVVSFPVFAETVSTEEAVTVNTLQPKSDAERAKLFSAFGQLERMKLRSGYCPYSISDFENGKVPAGTTAIADHRTTSGTAQIKIAEVVRSGERHPLPPGRVIHIYGPCQNADTDQIRNSLRESLCPVSKKEIAQNRIPLGAYVVIKGRKGSKGHVVIRGLRNPDVPNYSPSDIEEAYVSCQ